MNTPERFDRRVSCECSLVNVQRPLKPVSASHPVKLSRNLGTVAEFDKKYSRLRRGAVPEHPQIARRGFLFPEGSHAKLAKDKAPDLCVFDSPYLEELLG